MIKKRRFISWSTYAKLFLSTFIIDRCTKWLVLKYVHERMPLTDFVACDLVMNRGISWGLFHSSSNAVFIAVSVLIVIIIAALGFYAFINWMNNERIIGEVLVLSGALSNFIDRIFYQGVIDFIACSWHGWSFPVFNVADACIVIGVVCMLVENSRS